MVPKTAKDLVALLVSGAQARAYLDITRAAKKHRLDEADIADIERTILVEVSKVRAAEDELPFDVSAAAAQAEAILGQYFDVTKKARVTPNQPQKARGKD